MSKSKRAKAKLTSASAPPVAVSQPLLKRSDVVLLIVGISIVLTVFELWSPEATVSNGQIAGLSIMIGAIAMSSRYLSRYWRSKRAK